MHLPVPGTVLGIGDMKLNQARCVEKICHWIEFIRFSQHAEGHAITFVLLEVSFLSHLKNV